MKVRYHSVILDEDKCKGCTNCIKTCPTEAIRVRKGKAVILTERCLDCGECIRTCENHAKRAVGDTLANLPDFYYRVALPAPSLYAQFRPEVSPKQILQALLKIGFNEVYEVAYAAELTTYAIRRYLAEALQTKNPPLPLISSSCPTVVRLIQLRFPGLIPNVIPIDPPYLTAAKMFLRERLSVLGLPRGKIGFFFITPCPAKITEIKAEEDKQIGSYVDGAIPISLIYGELKNALESGGSNGVTQKSSGLGIGWGRAGGENMAIKSEDSMLVDGLHNVVTVLEEIELNKLSDIEYIEAMACPEGCVGGALTVENPFVARVKIRKLAEKHNDQELRPSVRDLGAELSKDNFFQTRQKPIAKAALQLDTNLGTAIKKMEQLEKIIKELPGLDCGACGSPTCRSLAEDIVQEQAQLTDCIILLREELEVLAKNLLILAQKRPPAMGEAYLDKEEKNDET